MLGMEMNDGQLTESSIAESLRVSKREVRHIAEMYNFRKWLDSDSTVKYVVIDKKYHIITKSSDKRDYVLNKRLFNLIKEAKAYKIYLEDIGGNTDQLHMSLDNLINNYEEAHNE